MASFTWPYDANTVHVTGSFNNWSERIPLTKDVKGAFHITIDLPVGEHEYKFIVDDRRWCYDIMKPTRADDKGNRNNVITVGRGQSAPPKGREQAAQPAKEEAKPVEKKQQQQQQGKKERQQQQKKEPQEQEQEQEQPEGGKKENDPAAVKGAAQKVISTVKSYGAPWFVADVDIEDNLDDVLTTANLFSEELPDSACMFLSGGTKTFIIVAAVPESKVSGANAIELINTALTVIANPPPAEGTNNLAYSIINADPEKGIFPLKLKDLTRGPVFALLKKRQLVKDEEEEDDNLPNWDDIE